MPLLGHLAFCLLFGYIAAEVVHYDNCSPLREGETADCIVHEVRIEPCKEAAKNASCRIRKGKVGSILFDFTPNFSGEEGELEAHVYWASLLGDVPFLGMDPNACLYTQCPIASGIKQSLNYSLSVPTISIARTYTVKWKIWNKQKKECCFLSKVKVI